MASNVRVQFLRLTTYRRFLSKRELSYTSVLLNNPLPESSVSKLTVPQPQGQCKTYSNKLEDIFNRIAELNLLEVAELSEILKRRLNLPDAPVMSFATKVESTNREEEEPEEKMVMNNFSVKLTSYDADKKVAVIKELKNLMPDLNLVQAKKLIDSVPTVIVSDVGKPQAQEFKDVLTKVGAEVVIE